MDLGNTAKFEFVVDAAVQCDNLVRKSKLFLGKEITFPDHVQPT